MDRWRERGGRHLWHPFTQMRDFYAQEALCIVGAQGNELIDAEGRRYLDAVASLWCNVFGHRHPRIDAAVRAQLDRLAHSTLLGLTHDRAIELAERLCAFAPAGPVGAAGLTRVFFSDDGATAVEVALKMAFQYWRLVEGEHTRRLSFARLDAAYHGDTLGAVSAGGLELFHALYRPLLFETVAVPPPRVPDEIDAALEALAPHAAALAAVLVEPGIQGAAGMQLIAPGFLAHLRSWCDAHGVLLIADEVATGFGRTGRMFACDLEGVRPDLLCLAKGLTGGYLPLAATLTTEAVYEAFLGPPAAGRQFFHGHTYTGNPLGCAAALATLAIFEEERVLEEAVPRALAALDAALAPLCAHPHVREIRRLGFMTGVELVADRARGRPFAPDQRAGHRVIMAMRAHGVIARPLGDVVVLNPPLSIRPAEIARMAAALGAGLDALAPLVTG